MNHDNRKKLKKNQIVHTIWLRFFRPYVPMNILSGWFLSVSLFVCVFYLYVFFFVCLCVYALSLRFFPIRTSVKSSRAHDFCLSVCLSLSCFFYFSVCLFISFLFFLFLCLFILLEDFCLSLSACSFISIMFFVCLCVCLFSLLLFIFYLNILLGGFLSVPLFVCLSLCLLLFFFDPKTNCSLSPSDGSNR
jgi:hypothetical protein